MTSPALRALRQWLTIPETAQELHAVLGHVVTEQEVLRLALEGHLKLSLYLPVALSLTCRRVDSEQLDPDTDHRKVSGLCDLPLDGRARHEVERQYQSLIGNYVKSPDPVGAFVEKDGWLCQLSPDYGATGMWPRSESEFPQGSVLCVTRPALVEFLATLAAPDSSPRRPTEAQPIGQRERDTLLVIIAALMKAVDIDRAQTSKAGATIEALTTEMGARVSRRAVEEHLKRIPHALERKGSDQA